MGKIISGGTILLFLFGIGFTVLLVKKLFIGDTAIRTLSPDEYTLAN